MKGKNMIVNEKHQTPFKLKELYDEFQSLPTQNQRILFFDDPNNISRMSEFDINIPNLKKHHIEVWDNAFSLRTWDDLQKEL